MVQVISKQVASTTNPGRDCRCVSDAGAAIRAREALREHEERLHALAEISFDAVMLTDLDGKVTACNSRTAALLGSGSTREILSKDSFAFIAPEDRRLMAENLIAVFEAGSVRHIPCTLLRNDTRFPAEVRIALLRSDHLEPVGFVQVINDISVQKEIEQTWADFVHGLSHDMKSPLSSINGWAELLRRTEPPDTRTARFASRILTASDATITMINQLLDVSSLEDTLSLNLAWFDLDDLAAQAVSDLDGAALVKSLRVDLQIIGRPRPIAGDRTRLYRSILNLLDNAIKYSPDGASILVTTCFEDHRVILRIRDRGPGIPEAELPYIFEKYYRGASVSGKRNGFGLGLATVQTAIKAHDGDVFAGNADGGGAEFTIILPAGPAEPHSP